MIDQYNDELGKRYAMHEQPRPNGIACPSCGDELWDTSPNTVLPSLPPKAAVHCPACGYKGYRIA